MEFEKEFNSVYVQPTLPADLAERYRIVSCLKYTDQKQIYLIEDIAAENKYIMKCAYGSFASLLKKERSVLEMAGSVISCPRIIEFAEEAEYSYIIREYISGETIVDIVERGELSEKEAFDITSKVCATLQKLHSLEPPIIVRDIKPENIVIREDECVFIDFDAAREWNEDGSTDTICIGTRTTAAPEQFGYRQTDVRTDIYALGMLMTYLLTGGYNKSEIKQKKAKKIVEKCTQFSPYKRYRNVSAVCKAMQPGKLPYILIPTVAAAGAAVTAICVLGSTSQNDYIMSDSNTFSFTKQADSFSDPIVDSALTQIDGQAGGAVRAGRSKREMIEYLLNDSQYAVFGGETWPCRATSNEDYFISYVGDNELSGIDGTTTIKLDSKSSASMSTGWFISGVVYTEDVSLQSFRVYIDGNAGEYRTDEFAAYMKKHLQAGEQIRIDETRSMSFVSCDDNGFYFIEYGSNDNTDCHLRLRYYSFDDFISYLNGLNKQVWYYEIEQSINQ